jgi:hypothetical protein
VTEYVRQTVAIGAIVQAACNREVDVVGFEREKVRPATTGKLPLRGRHDIDIPLGSSPFALSKFPDGYTCNRCRNARRRVDVYRLGARFPASIVRVVSSGYDLLARRVLQPRCRRFDLDARPTLAAADTNSVWHQVVSRRDSATEMGDNRYPPRLVHILVAGADFDSTAGQCD